MHIYSKVYETKESKELFDFLNEIEVEYHKKYIRYNKEFKVPRGQASFTYDESVHYNYPAAGGSPPNYIMNDKLRKITEKVNKVLATNFNTILLNKYVDGDDCIGFHRDNQIGWAPRSGFATLAFGVARDFQIKCDETKVLTTILHEPGYVIYMPDPMNSTHTHSVPKRRSLRDCRISLTFREITNPTSTPPAAVLRKNARRRPLKPQGGSPRP
jgi:alkylated DNA repair dioxygenase AlkB